MKKTLFCIIITLSLFASLKVTYAQEGNAAIGIVDPPPLIDRSPDAITNYIPTIVNTGFFIGLMGALIYIVYGGIKWITAGGDSKALTSARDTIMHAIVGLILLSVAFAVTLIFNTMFQPSAPLP